MAVYTAQPVTDIISQDLADRDFLSVNQQTPDQNTYDPQGYTSSEPLSADINLRDPYTVIHKYSSEAVTSSTDTFYNSPHFVQDLVVIDGGTVSLGIITQNTSAFFGLFNNLRQPRTVQDVGIASSTAGVTINNMSSGTVLGSYEEFVVQLDIDGVGDAVVVTEFYIRFADSPSITYTISVMGVRYGLFYASSPNWADTVMVERRYLTSVFTSSNMSETRKLLRSRPVRAMTATHVFSGKDAASQLWACVRNRAAIATAYPWFPDQTAMTADNDSMRVYCSTEYRRFSEGGYAFLSSGDNPDQFNTSEVVRIDEVFTDGFSTISDIQGTYLQGSFAIPAFIGLADISGQTLSIETDRKGSVSMTVEEVYNDATLPNENDSYSPTIKNSLAVLDLELTWTEIPEQTILMGGDVASSGRGFTQNTLGMPYITQSVTALAKNKQECWELDGFFNYIRGRGRMFWAVDSLDMLIFVSSASSTQVTLGNSNAIADWDYLTYVKAVASNEDYEMLEVLDRQVVADETVLTLETNSLSDIVSVQQVHKVRLAEDVVASEYLTDSVCLTRFSVQELQEG